MMGGGGELLEIDRLSKAYGPLQALDDVTLRLRASTIHGLVGHNGAGKSTLVKTLTGATRPDAGEIRLGGRRVEFDAPADALRAGVVPIHQDVAVIPNLSVQRNLLLGLRDVSPERALAVAEEVGLNVDLRTLAGALSPAAQRLLMLAQAVLRKPRVLLLDEPTAVLDQRDAGRLFDLLRRLRGAGLSIVYISHRLDEVLDVCDEITVMRQGRVLSHIADPSKLSTDGLASAIVGVAGTVGHGAGEPADDGVERDARPTALEVTAVSCLPKLRGISFSVGEGEIVGIAGLVGSGRSTLLRCLAGLQPTTGGSVRAVGHELRMGHPDDARRRGLVYISERSSEAGIQTMTVAENLLLPQLRRYRVGRFVPLLSKRRMGEAARDLAGELQIGSGPGSIGNQLRSLSGGNQRKVALARWMSLDARIFLLDEPTTGLDIGARAALYELLRSLASGGASIVMTSADTDEVVSVSDRVLALHGGRIVRELSGHAKTEEAVSLACFGAGVPGVAEGWSAATTLENSVTRQ